MDLRLTIIFLAAIFMGAKCELQWENLTRENFTTEHNWAMLKAHARDWTHLMELLSKPAARAIKLEQTVFKLYTRNGPTDGSKVSVGDVSGLTAGKFDKKKPSIFATHGFLSGASTSWMVQMKTAQLQSLDCNFFTIDWSECADTLLYPSAVDCTKTVGGYLAQLIAFLGQQGAVISDMHLMGHSLGAHLVAQISLHGHKVARITGWDPAGPLFGSGDLPSRIDPSDAAVVDVIHTNCFMFGYDGLLGHYDFFPNGGDDQTGCIPLDYLCDHSMSYYYYIQSLYNPTKYLATECASMDQAKKGKCSGGSNYMGVASVQGFYTDPYFLQLLGRAGPLNWIRSHTVLKPDFVHRPKGIYYIKVKEVATGNPE